MLVIRKFVYWQKISVSIYKQMWQSITCRFSQMVIINIVFSDCQWNDNWDNSWTKVTRFKILNIVYKYAYLLTLNIFLT